MVSDKNVSVESTHFRQNRLDFSNIFPLFSIGTGFRDISSLQQYKTGATKDSKQAAIPGVRRSFVGPDKTNG